MQWHPFFVFNCCLCAVWEILAMYLPYLIIVGFVWYCMRLAFMCPQVEANPRHFVTFNDSYCVKVFSDISYRTNHTGPGLTPWNHKLVFQCYSGLQDFTFKGCSRLGYHNLGFYVNSSTPIPDMDVRRKVNHFQLRSTTDFVRCLPKHQATVGASHSYTYQLFPTNIFFLFLLTEITDSFIQSFQPNSIFTD